MADPEVTDQSRLANLIQKEEEINRSLPRSTPQKEEFRTATPLKILHAYAHSQHLKLNIAKTQLISTTKSITPPAFPNSININTHLHVQAKTRDIILISSFPYFQFPVHRQTLLSIPSKHVILFQ